MVPTGPGIVIGLFGPTGVGKTEVGLELARRLGTRVISCDSLQLYRGFPVLTNQPTAEELTVAPHAFVGVLDPQEEWSAVGYGVEARRLVAEDVASRGWALVSGGTGLYLRAALAPLQSPTADPDDRLRRRLQERGLREGSAALHAELARLDPPAAASIHPNNLRRIVRALEVVTVAGEPVWSGRGDLWEPDYVHPTLVVGLTRERGELYGRIDQRAAQMVAGGAREEVRRYRESRGRCGMQDCLPAGRGVEKAIGYRDLCLHLEGGCSEEEAAERLAAATRRYARRQLTWMRKLRDAVMIDASHRAPVDVAEEILGLAAAHAVRPG